MCETNSTISLRAALLTSFHFKSLRGSITKSNRTQHCLIFWINKSSLSAGVESGKKNSKCLWANKRRTNISDKSGDFIWSNFWKIKCINVSANQRPVWTCWILNLTLKSNNTSWGPLKEHFRQVWRLGMQWLWSSKLKMWKFNDIWMAITEHFSFRNTIVESYHTIGKTFTITMCRYPFNPKRKLNTITCL